MVFSSSGRIYYVSESVTSLLGYLPNELENTTIYDITYQEDQSALYNVLLNPANTKDRRNIKKGIFLELNRRDFVQFTVTKPVCIHLRFLISINLPFKTRVLKVIYIYIFCARVFFPNSFCIALGCCFCTLR